MLYKQNNLSKIYPEVLNNLKYIFNVLILEHVNKELVEKLNNKETANDSKGVVIDVTDD
jgi:hypothetical protein